MGLTFSVGFLSHGSLQQPFTSRTVVPSGGCLRRIARENKTDMEGPVPGQMLEEGERTGMKVCKGTQNMCSRLDAQFGLDE